MKWQYWITSVAMGQRSGLPNTMNQAGQQGWELVNVLVEEQDTAGQVMVLFFKKPA